MSPLTRRTLLVGGSALPLALSASVGSAAAAEPGEPTEVHWLEGGFPAEMPGVTWGLPWPKGQLRPDQSFGLHTPDGTPVAMQTWPIGFWPDGSLKWSAHTIPAGAPASE